MDRPPPIIRSSSSSTVGADVTFHSYSPDHLIHDPLCSGFLLKHCKEQFSDENMLFVVAVDRFRDYFHRDNGAWSHIPWRKLDDEYISFTHDIRPETESVDDFLIGLQDPNFFPEESWPSTIVSRDAIRDIISRIIKEFLIKDADKWICISQTVLFNTLKRIRLLHIYGREAFAEALIDPLRTIERDIYPRFQTSTHYRRMLETKQMLDRRAYMEKFRLPKPERHIHQKYTKQQLLSGKVLFSLAEIIDDGTLYEEFHKYLESCVSDENLRCIRALNIYKETFTSTIDVKRKESQDFAVLVYRYFVASRAPFEICISHVHANEILRGLADPYPTLFEAVERSAMDALQTHFHNYRNTPQYANLGRHLATYSKLPPLGNAGNNNRNNNSNNNSNSNTNSRHASLHTPHSHSHNSLQRPSTTSSAATRYVSSNSSSNPYPINNSNNNASNYGSNTRTLSSSVSTPTVSMSSILGACFPLK